MTAGGTTRRSSSAASSRFETPPTLAFERRAWENGNEIVAGVDEAGRGAWAGPLVAAAAIVPRDGKTRGRLTRALNSANLIVDDSKRMTHSARCAIEHLLQQFSVVTSVAVIPVEDIDRDGVGHANRVALSLAAAGLNPSPEHLLVDAFNPLDPPCSWDAIIHGDQRSFAIAMASIVAKVHRDALMDLLDAECPGYGFGRHKGYGTATHRAALAKLGVSSHHRKSFSPIADLLAGPREQR